MEIETSVDEGSEFHHVDACGSSQGSDEEEYGLADAFMQFEAQAEKRTLELLKATDKHLFNVSQEDSTPLGDGEEEGNYPAYVYMSDQFRLKKPPQFQHWQQNFQYLQVTGSRMLDGESMDHVHLVPMELKEGDSVCRYVDDIELQVKGFACLEEPTEGSQGGYEEIILCDGLMEEMVEHNEDVDNESEHGRFSPHTTDVEEVLDELTMECFSTTVAPMLTSIYKTMLEKQQDAVKSAREAKEAAANRTIEEQVAFEKAKQLQTELQALEEAARIEAMELQRQEEERKVTERRKQILKQQLEENDGEEVKIQTLAYSHTREWYQPNKKCFSHRGRQLTYLKPVRQIKDSEEVLITDISPNIDHRHTKQAKLQKKPRSERQKPQSEWVTGGALTNDKLCEVSWVKKIARPPANVPPSSTRSRRRRKDGNQKDDATLSRGVQLPLIPRLQSKASTVTPKSSVRKLNADSKLAQASASPALKSQHPASPYQVPPRLIAEGSRNQDRHYYPANVVKQTGEP